MGILIGSILGYSKGVVNQHDNPEGTLNSTLVELFEDEQQRLANIFFDHFYNRVIHYSGDESTKVNVPFNFRTPKGWNKIFQENDLEQKSIEYLGIDQPTVPEYHTLHEVIVK